VKRIRHFLEYLLAFMLVLALIFTIASVIVVKYYGNELKDYAMKTINDQVDTKIQVGEVGISMLKDFPYSSVFFTDVVVWSGYDFDRLDFPAQYRDTLLSTSYIALRFNPFDLVRRKFNVKSFTAEDGVLNMLTDKSGGVNYTFRKEKNDPPGQTPLVELRKVRLNDFEIHVVNLPKAVEGKFLVHDVGISGNFSSNNYQMNLGGSALLHSWIVSDIEYFSNQQIQSEISFNVSDQTYHIARGNLDLGFIVADVSGTIAAGDQQGADLSLELDARKVDLPWLLDLVLKNSESRLDQLKVKGNADFSASVSGLMSAVSSPHIEAGISLRNASLSAEFLPVPFSKIILDGRFSNGEQNSMQTSTLDMHTLNFSALNGDIRSSIEINNLVEPLYRIQARGDLPVEDLQKFFPGLTIELTNGMVHPDVTLSGRITGLRQGKAIFSLFPGGIISINGISGKSGANGILFKNLTGTIDMGYQQWSANFSGEIAGSEFKLDMEHNNPISFLRGEGMLNVYSRFRSPLLNLDNLVSGNKHKPSESNSTWPEKITLAFDAEIDQLHFRNATFSNIRASGGYAYPSFFIEKSSASGWNGRISASGILDNLDREIKSMSVESQLVDADIGDLFQTFNNFGQDEITDKHIRGKLTATTALTADIGKDNALITHTIASNSDIVVRQGELINFEPIIKVSDLLRIEKLDKVAFSTLENSILIAENTITIPEMEIRSNSLNLKASGKQQLSGNYRYHLAVRLSEILFSKARNSANREFDIALDEEDQRTVFLVVYDEGNGMSVDFDEAQAMKKIRSDLKAEKEELREIFRQEFRKPAAAGSKENVPAEDVPVMKFEFTDEEPDTLPSVQPKEKRKWWQRKENKKEELDFVIDDSDGK